MHRADYLTTFDDAPTPYYSSSQRIVDYGISVGWVLPDDGQPVEKQAGRIRDQRTAAGLHDWQLHAQSVGLRWMTVRDFCDVVEGGVKNLAIVAHQLKVAVDKGVLERKQINEMIRGRIEKRWAYRAKPE